MQTMWYRMVIIGTKHHLTWPRQKFVHIHNHIIHYHTRNVCFVVVPIAHVLIYQSKNHRSIIKKHVLLYLFIFITWLHGVQCREDTPWTKIILFACVCVILFICHLKNIYARKELVMMETSIYDSHTHFYIPDIQKLLFNLPHIDGNYPFYITME